MGSVKIDTTTFAFDSAHSDIFRMSLADAPTPTTGRVVVLHVGRRILRCGPSLATTFNFLILNGFRVLPADYRHPFLAKIG